MLESRSELPKRLEARYLAKVEKINAGRERRESGQEWSLQARREKNAEKYNAVREQLADQAAAKSKRTKQLTKDAADPFADHR